MSLESIVARRPSKYARRISVATLILRTPSWMGRPDHLILQARPSVENQMGDLGLQLPNAPQQFKVQLWLRLIETMRIADGDRQGIHIDAVDKCLHLRDTDLCRTISDNPVLCPGNRSQFASTLTPTAWAALITSRVCSIFSRSGSEDPSNMTEVNPARMQATVCSKLAPWSRCRTTGRADLAASVFTTEARRSSRPTRMAPCPTARMTAFAPPPQPA